MRKNDKLEALKNRKKNNFQDIDTSTPAEEAAENAEKALKKQETEKKEESEKPEEPKTEIKTVEKDQNIEPESTETTENEGLLDYTYKAAESSNGNMVHTSLHLTPESYELLTMRSSQMGMNMQDYFNMLVEEEKKSPDREMDPEILDQLKDKDKKIKNMQLTNENYLFMKAASAMLGVKPTVVYANYLILKEHKREEKYGKRPGKYDAFLKGLN